MKRLAGPVLGLLLAQVCCVKGVDVEQSPPALSLQEGDSSTLWCSFSTTVNNVQWYRQYRNGSLVHLFFISSGTKQNGRLNATTVTTERRSSLHISSAQITDSATYLCAVEHSAPQAPAACTGTLRGAQPLLQPRSHHRAFTFLIIPHLHWYPFNYKHFLALQIWDFGLLLPSQSVSPSALETSNLNLVKIQK
uniref:Ig-like domain-containing protein n=1 Tax=Sus scrofa TaxID=9823 RepID=A0A8D0X6A1_PIG